MIDKRVLCSQRVRRIPPGFGWVDHRLVRHKHISRCGPEALALYLLLITVGDAEGLSYYSDGKAAKLIQVSREALARAREELVEAGLIAYQRPLYQVLSLDAPIAAIKGNRRTVSLGEVLEGMSGGQQ